MTHTVRLHRVLRAPPERVYRAFLDADAMVKWLPPHGFTGKVHHMDARVGGTHKMSFSNFSTGSSHSFGGTYLELVPGELIRYTVRVLNSGNVTMHDVGVDVARLGGRLACVPTMLAPQALADCGVHDYEVLEADLLGASIGASAVASGLAPAAAEPTHSAVVTAATPVDQGPYVFRDGFED